MRRFYIHPQAICHDRATLSDVESHHITTVLRLETGSAIELFDGTGTIYSGSIETVDRKGVTVRIHSRRHNPTGSDVQITLAQGLLKGKKMDLLVQKATEMGVYTLQPLRTRYSEGRGHQPRQLERWKRIMLEACKQCLREKPMLIPDPLAFDTLSTATFATKIMFWEGEKIVALRPGHLSPSGSICLLLGPEGGFHPGEIDLARYLGFRTVSLGGHVLRAETASLAAIAIVQYLVGAFDAPLS
jgi:16S rRNA (uracil1498-N3)-methyltransferase